MTDIYAIEIQNLVQNGCGLGRLPDGRAIFIPFTMPGEIVQARIIREKKKHVFGLAQQIITPHPTRIQPRCRHFGSCGGCHFQHIPYDLQLDIKRQIFIETMERIGGIRINQEINFVASPAVWNYRNALQFRLSPRGQLSFADWLENRFFTVEECLLPMPLIERIWREMEFEGSDIERVELRQNNCDDLMVIFHGRADNLPELETHATASIVHMDGEDIVVMAGYENFWMQVDGKEFQVSPGSFFQTNYSAAAALVRLVKEQVKKYECQTVMDLYSGVGFFSAFLAQDVERITAVESSPAACVDYAVNLDAYDHISLYEGDVEHVLPLLNEGADCVILDPPRAGLRQSAAHAILKMAAPLVIYISCNPATLARDSRLFLQNGYRLDSMTLLDMFPQTYHVEAVVLMSRVER